MQKAMPQKATSKKATPKKAVKKVVAKKGVIKKIVPKKAVPKKAVKTATSKKAAPKKPAPKKIAAKKVISKKAATKKSTVRKAIPKKAVPVKKTRQQHSKENLPPVDDTAIANLDGSDTDNNASGKAPIEDNGNRPVVKVEDPLLATDQKTLAKAFTKYDPKHPMQLSSSKSKIKPSGKKPLWRK